MDDHVVVNTNTTNIIDVVSTNMTDIINDATSIVDEVSTNMIDVVSTNMADIITDTINTIDFDKISFDFGIIPNLFLILFFLIYKWNDF